jgi:hypothetical protein
LRAKNPPRSQFKPPPIKPVAKVETLDWREVWTSAVGALGPSHKQMRMADGSYAPRTVCGNWPGNETPNNVPDNRCPVCFGDPSRPSEGARK